MNHFWEAKVDQTTWGNHVIMGRMTEQYGEENFEGIVDEKA